MQSIDVQRNDFEKELWTMRNYDGWDYTTIVQWIRNRQVNPFTHEQISANDIVTFLSQTQHNLKW